MKATSFSVERLLSLFKKQKIATMSELKKVLGSDCSMTVFRKLRELGYITSCSHSGKFYSLNRFVGFDHMGLWFFNSVLFSYYGTLAATLKALIEKSDNGYTAVELERILSVKPNGPLIDLIGKKRIRREKISGVYVYFSKNANVKKQQELARKESMSRLEDIRFATDLPLHEIKAAIILFYSILNEKQRRLYAGLESLRVGHGGDRLIAELLALNEKTVSKGRKELLEREVVIDSIRRKGGGRKTIKKNPRGDRED